jgi:hypothetical protein
LPLFYLESQAPRACSRSSRQEQSFLSFSRIRR